MIYPISLQNMIYTVPVKIEFTDLYKSLGLPVPSYATQGSVGADLYACLNKSY